MPGAPGTTVVDQLASGDDDDDVGDHGRPKCGNGQVPRCAPSRIAKSPFLCGEKFCPYKKCPVGVHFLELLIFRRNSIQIEVADTMKERGCKLEDNGIDAASGSSSLPLSECGPQVLSGLGTQVCLRAYLGPQDCLPLPLEGWNGSGRVDSNPSGFGWGGPGTASRAVLTRNGSNYWQHSRWYRHLSCWHTLVSYLPGCFPPVERSSDVPAKAATQHRIFQGLRALGGEVAENQKALAVWSC